MGKVAYSSKILNEISEIGKILVGIQKDIEYLKTNNDSQEDDIEELKNFKGTLIGTAKVVAYAITIAVASGGVFIIAKVLSYI